MGLLKAGAGALGGALADSWREYFYCESLSADVLAAKGEKRTGGRSSNKKGENNIISNGSIIAVNDGQCMIIVDQGKIVEACAEPGEFIYDTSTEPSIFYGSLGENIKKTFEIIGRRVGFGGDTGKDQRVYYLNTKEIPGNKYGTPSPVPFRVVDNRIGLDVDIAIRCHGEYSYKITNPLLFYTNVCGNVQSDYTRDNIDGQLKTELLTALSPALAKISALGVRYSELPGHATEIADALNDELTEKWTNLRGIEIVSFGVSSATASEEDEKMIKEIQRNSALREPGMAAAHMAGATAQAMQDAAKNQSGMGSMGAFMGMNMAGMTGGANMANIYAAGGGFSQQQAANANGGWTCSCGSVNDGKFCKECGKPKPEAKATWTCSCGNVNDGKFCSSCGKPMPTAGKCPHCGAEVAGNAKFCPECGKALGE